jgi:hypothetical protein
MLFSIFQRRPDLDRMRARVNRLALLHALAGRSEKGDKGA